MSTTDFGKPDVIVVGAGNAACCAALAARENGASVIMLEAAPIEDSGGNSRYTGGLMRVVYNNVEDVAQLIPDLTEEEKKTHDYGSYTADDYFDDMGRITQYMSDPDLTEILITKQLRDAGVAAQERRALPAELRPPVVQGRRRRATSSGAASSRRPGAAARAWSTTSTRRASAKASRSSTRRRRCRCSPTTTATCIGVQSEAQGHATSTSARKAVVLACGGFESSAEMRARYLGPGWDLAKVRGTRYNTGRGHQDGARHRRDASRPLVGLPRGGLGPQRAAVRRRQRRRPVPEAQLSVGHHDQRQRRALRRRRRGLPQLHLRQVRPRDPEPARHVRVAGVRPEAHPDAARRVPHQAGDQGAREHARRAVQEDGRRQRRARAARRSRNTTRRCRTTSSSTWRSRTAAARRASRSTRRTGRTRIDEPPFEAYARHLRRHVQLRRAEDHQRRRSARTRPASRSPGCSPRASSSAASSITTIRAARGSPPARCSARSPATSAATVRRKRS